MANELASTPANTPGPADDGSRGLGGGDNLTLRLEVPEILVEAGGAAVENVITLSNPSQEDPYVQYTFEVTDLNPAWYKLDLESVLLPRGASQQVRLKFQVPRRGAQPGVFMYRVQAQADDPPARGATTGRVRVTSPPTLQMTLDPAAATGREARYTVQLVNAPTSDLIVDLQGKDPANTLAITPTPARVRLAPSAEAQATLDVGIRPGVVGEARAYPFTLVATLSSDDEDTLPVTCEGSFVYVPDIQIQMRIESEKVNGPMGDYRIVLTNPTSLNFDVDLAAESPGETLDIFLLSSPVSSTRGLEPEPIPAAESRDLELEPTAFRLRLPRLETATVKALVRIVAPDDSSNEPRTYPFTIRAKIANTDGPGAAEQTATSELRYTPNPLNAIYARLQQTRPVVEKPTAPAVRLRLDPAQATGDPARFTVLLENRGTAPVRAELRAAEEQSALDFAFDPPALDLDAGQSAPATLAVRLRPDAPGVFARDPQPYPFEVACRVGEITVETVPGAFTQGTLEADLVPANTHGAYEVRLRNGAIVPMQVVLRGRDAHDELTYRFTPARLLLAPGSAQTVRLAVRPAPGIAPLRGQSYPFEVLCWVPGTDRILAVSGELRNLGL